MAAKNGNKYAMIGEEEMTGHIHCRISQQDKKDFKEKCESLGVGMSEAIKKIIKYYTNHRPK